MSLSGPNQLGSPNSTTIRGCQRCPASTSSSAAAAWRAPDLSRNGGACSPTMSMRARARPMPPIGEASNCCIADVASLRAADLPGRADLAWASFPCQDLSLAGAGAGLTALASRRLLGLLLGDARPGGGGTRAARNRARERGRRAHLQGRGGFRGDLRGAPGPRLSLRRGDDRCCAFSAAVAAARVLCCDMSQRSPAPLADLARPAVASHLDRARARRLRRFPRRSPPIGYGGARQNRRARTFGWSTASKRIRTGPAGTASNETQRLLTVLSPLRGGMSRSPARAGDGRDRRAVPPHPPRRLGRRSRAGRGALRWSRGVPEDAWRRVEPPISDRCQRRQDPGPG